MTKQKVEKKSKEDLLIEVLKETINSNMIVLRIMNKQLKKKQSVRMINLNNWKRRINSSNLKGKEELKGEYFFYG